MEIGTTLNLVIEEPDSNQILKYRSKIIEKNNEYLFIDYPINIATKREEFFPTGTEFTAIWINNHQNLYRFQTTLVKKVNLMIPALAITLPDLQSIEIIQRRDHLRIKTAVDIAIHCPNGTFSPFTTVTLDISGGGLAFKLPNGVKLKEKQEILVWIALPMSNENKYMKLKSKVIRFQNTESFQVVSVKFISISDKEEQNIIKFCFNKQREERMSEWM